MAVTKMKKLMLLGLNQDKEHILRDIAFTGSVELTDQTAKLSDEEWAGLFSQDGPDAECSDLETELSSIRVAISALSPFAGKKKLFSGRTEKTRLDFDRTVAQKETLLDVVRQVCGILNQKAEKESKINLLRSLAASIAPWASVDIPLSFRTTGSSKVCYGILPIYEKTERIEEELSVKTGKYCLSTVNEDKQFLYIQIVYHQSAEEVLFDILKLHAFTEVAFDADGGLLPAAWQTKCLNNVEKLEKECCRLTEKLSDFAKELPNIEFLHDALSSVFETKQAKNRLLVTGNTFLMEGFVPVPTCTAIQDILSKYNVFLELTDPSKEDDTPVLLHNSKLIEPYEMVTSMYSLPQYGGLDPDAVVSPFFCIFFGMMLSDAGYGLILFLLGLFAQKKMKLTGTMKRMAGLMVQGGLSSIVVGIIYGSYFGDAVNIICNTFFHSDFALKAFFDPMSNPMQMLYVCVAIGFIHIVVGMGVQAYQLIKDGQLLDAIFDIGFWYVVFAGFIVLIIGTATGAFPYVYGLYVAAVGAVGLILTQGRSKNNVFSKFTSGLLSLYGITGYVSDLLSYSRLMALGLSTGVIASVFNKLGSLAGRSIIGAILFLLVFLIGQIFNLAMSSLGAFVHSSRLTYVEFFGKFYSGGGREFAPLKLKNRYVALNIEQNKK